MVRVRVTCGYSGLHVVTPGYMWLHQVTCGYRRLNVVTPDYKWLQWVTCGYTGVITRNPLKPHVTSYNHM